LGLLAVPVLALLSFLVTLIVAVDGPLKGSEKIACHGRYECPF
jgi:hypothetical protein